jgi:hypothetical protein
MSRLGAIAIGSLLLAGCASVRPQPPACPVGQTFQRTAQLFFGRTGADAPRITDAAFRRYVDEELTPRFPDGLTVMDGGGKWRGDENRMIREASKVVLIVLPAKRDADRRVQAARAAYRSRFHQTSVMLVNPASCVSF